MRIKCIKPCERMAVGETGDFKSLRTSGTVPTFRVKLVTGVTVTVPTSCCEIIQEEKVEV